jgi:FtsP/CotA-like multicopper oxidase with cupredoxin domain
MAVNGSIPGPTIIADWGDHIVVHVTNSLTESKNGSSIHWYVHLSDSRREDRVLIKFSLRHGLRQNQTNQMDGVVSVTQCPTAPGDTYTYAFRATQYGSSWYHSHFALQAWEGIFGGIIINGPATADYDEDLGNLFLQDWSHQTVDELYIKAQTNGIVTMDNGLINGTNVFDSSSGETGTRFSTNFSPGVSYRLRLVNVAIDTHFKFSIDNHTMTVIATDFVPIVPYNTTTVNIGMGQRYDVIVTADQAALGTDFWMRAIPQVACSASGAVDNIKGIIHYGSSTGTPTTTGYSYNDECIDEPYASLVPHVPNTVGSSSISEAEAVTVGKNADGLFRWSLNGTSMTIEWDDPVSPPFLSHTTTNAYPDPPTNLRL